MASVAHNSSRWLRTVMRATTAGKNGGTAFRAFTSTVPRMSDKSARDYLAAWVGHTPGDRYLKTIEERMRLANQASPAAGTAARARSGARVSSANDTRRLFNIPTLSLQWPANRESFEDKVHAMPLADQQTMRDFGVLLEFTVQTAEVGTVNEVQQSFSEYKAMLQEHQIRVIGVANCPPALQTPLKALGVLLIAEQPGQPPSSAPAAASSRATSGAERQTERASKKSIPVPSAQFVHGTVRSGQQVYAEGRSLVILGGVNEGAEIMADGDIHVYGRLQGRAVAGLSGDRSAKIFTSNFDAPLIGISDIFKLSEEDLVLKSAIGKAVMIHIESVQKEGSRDPQLMLQATPL